MYKVYKSHKDVKPNPELLARFKANKGNIDLSDMPELTEEQMKEMRPPTGHRLFGQEEKKARR